MKTGVIGSKDLVEMRSFSLKTLCVKWKVINNFIFSQSYQVNKNSFMTDYLLVIHREFLFNSILNKKSPKCFSKKFRGFYKELRAIISNLF